MSGLSVDGGGTSSFDIEVRFSDLDLFGHVNHASYFVFCEQHRGFLLREMLRETGVDLVHGGFVIAHAEGDFLRPVRAETEFVRVEMSVERLGTSSLHALYTMFAAEHMVARIRSVLVFVDDAGAARPLGEAERAFFQRFVLPPS
jgi:acyl-CoA thioester hydrolase